MGNYNAQYQSYYNNLGKKRNVNNFGGDNYKRGNKSNFFVKTLTRQLIGVLLLLILVLFCKVVVTPKTEFIYNYSKEAINKHYDYSLVIDKAKAINIKDIGTMTTNLMEKVKSTFKSVNILDDRVYNSEKL